jgi:periplasmic divalent cation tolerance protein
VFTTLPELAAAQTMARELLEARLAACVHIGPAVQSLYHWRGQIETGTEVPLAIKTRTDLFEQLELAIRARHSYELPEIVGVPITHGFPAYLEWIAHETRHGRLDEAR